MSQGQGSFQTNQRQIPAPAPGPPGPPFLLTSANNGLSVDPITGKIVLGQDVGAGGDPAQLLSNRQIPLSGFKLQVDQLGFSWLLLDPVNFDSELLSTDGTAISAFRVVSQSGLSNVNINGSVFDGANQITFEHNTSQSRSNITFNGSRFFNLDFLGNIYQLGDVDVSGNGSLLRIDDTARVTEIDINGGAYLSLDNNLGLYELGDVNGLGNQGRISINDPGSVTSMQATQGGAGHAARVLLIGAAGSELASMFTTVLGTTTLSSVDGVNGIWRAFSDGNGTFLRMSDFNQQVEAGNDNGAGTVIHYLKLDKLTELYQIGDVDDSVNGTRIDIFNTSNTINIRNINRVLGEFDFSTGFPIVNLGDTTAAANGTTFGVHDQTGEFAMQNLAGNSFIRINGTVGFTGTVTPVTTITVDGGIVTNVA